jgi:hypothetical protein
MFTTIALKAHEKTPTIEMEFGWSLTNFKHLGNRMIKEICVYFPLTVDWNVNNVGNVWSICLNANDLLLCWIKDLNCCPR